MAVNEFNRLHISSMNTLGIKSLSVLLVTTFFATNAFSQGDPAPISEKSRAYHEARLHLTEPSYSLSRVKALIKAIKEPKTDADFGTKALDGKIFGKLTVKEKFTYCMIYGENFSQNCDGMPAFINEETKIFGHPSGAFSSEEDWSARQNKFLLSHRATVIRLLKETIRAKGEVGANLKKAVLTLHAHEVIPDLVSAYKKSRQDLEILATLSNLMSDAKYRPYMKTKTYKLLYGQKESNYKSFVPFSKEAENTIIANAESFHLHRAR